MTDRKKLKKLTRQDVENKALRTEEVPVAAWGGIVDVRPMTGREGQEFQQRAQTDAFEKVAIEQMADVVQRCTVDPIFESTDEVMEMPVEGINVVFHAVVDLSGFGDDAVDEAEGNSEPTPSDASPTD